jgi:hypothetical protein
LRQIGYKLSPLFAATRLYAAAYRPLRRETGEKIDVWPAKFDVGDALPKLLLYVGPELAVMVDLDAAFQETPSSDSGSVRGQIPHSATGLGQTWPQSGC